MQIISGTRIGRQGQLRLGCSAALLSENRSAVLLIRRTDTGGWSLPGGGLEPGESVSEACAREFLEETGLTVHPHYLVGVYSNPDRLVRYPDDNSYHLIALHFEVKLIGGNLVPTSEASLSAFFTREQISSLEVVEVHRERIEDTFAYTGETFIR